jgi:hypothetical protein
MIAGRLLVLSAAGGADGQGDGPAGGGAPADHGGWGIAGMGASPM